MTAILPGPAYRIHTNRLVLRCWQPSDAQMLKDAIDASLDHLRPWMPWAEDEPTDLQTKINLLRTFRGEFDLGHDYVYGIFNRDESQVLGGTGLHKRGGPHMLEIGYWVHYQHIRQGIATEVAGALTRVGFEVEHMDRMEILCLTNNVASASVPPKLGYRHEATLRRRLDGPEGTLQDGMVWTLFADEYPSSPAVHATLEAFDAIGRKIIG